MNRIKLLIFSAMLLMLPVFAFADVFDITIDVDNSGNLYRQSFTSVESLFDEVDTSRLERHFTSYDENTSTAYMNINFRGVPIRLAFNDNSTKLSLSIPSIGVNKTFEGNSRDDSVDMLEDWFKKDGGRALTDLQKELIAETPSDPIAGNPTSLMSRMTAMDYDQAVSPENVIEMNPGAGCEFNANLISVFARYSNYTSNGVTSKEYALPLAYTIRFNGSKNTLAIRIPVSYVNVDGSEAYNTGLGLALGYQVNDRWKVTPAVGYGAVGSIELGSVGQIVSGSLTSAYQFKLNKFDIIMGNMAGYYKTIPFSYDDYDFDPDISNTVLRNGLNFRIPLGAEKGTSLELFVVDTRYFGSELYIDAYNEVGFSYGFDKKEVKSTAKGMKSYVTRLRGGLTYLFAEDASGYTVNFGFTF